MTEQERKIAEAVNEAVPKDVCRICYPKLVVQFFPDSAGGGTVKCPRCGVYQMTATYRSNPYVPKEGQHWQQLSAAIRQGKIKSLDYGLDWDFLLREHRQEYPKCEHKLITYLGHNTSPVDFIELRLKFDFTLFDMESGEELDARLKQLTQNNVVESEPESPTHFRLTAKGRTFFEAMNARVPEVIQEDT